MAFINTWLLPLLGGLAAGALFVWLWSRSRERETAARLEERGREVERLTREAAGSAEAKDRATRLEAELAAERRGTEEKLALLRDAEVKMREAFAALSSEALKANNQQFLELASTKLTNFQDAAKTDLDARQKAIADLVKPVEESLKRVDERIGAVEKDRVGSYAELRAHVEEMAKSQKQLRDETQNLVKALRAPQIRGAWGEIQLRRVVEMAGMLEHCDFDEQVSTTNSDGRSLRPDLVIRLPGDKTIVVDSKAPLAAYLEAMEAPDEESRAAHLAHHARQVKSHISQLAAKSYWNQFPNAPDFVVMFLPGESFFSAACQVDPTLINHAVDQSVIPASPTTLITLLRTVQFGWRQERIAANAEEIRQLGSDLYDRLRTLAEHLGDVGKGLTRATEAYNRAVGSFENRALASARKFQELGVTEAKEIEAVGLVETGVRELITRNDASGAFDADI